MFDQEDDKEHCQRCWTIMLLEEEAPKLRPLRELRTYKCRKCGHVIKYEIEPQTGWAQYAFDLKPRA